MMLPSWRGRGEKDTERNDVIMRHCNFVAKNRRAACQYIVTMMDFLSQLDQISRPC